MGQLARVALPIWVFARLKDLRSGWGDWGQTRTAGEVVESPKPQLGRHSFLSRFFIKTIRLSVARHEMMNSVAAPRALWLLVASLLLVVTSASLVVTSALLVVTRS